MEKKCYFIIFETIKSLMTEFEIEINVPLSFFANIGTEVQNWLSSQSGGTFGFFYDSNSGDSKIY